MCKTVIMTRLQRTYNQLIWFMIMLIHQDINCVIKSQLRVVPLNKYVYNSTGSNMLDITTNTINKALLFDTNLDDISGLSNYDHKRQVNTQAPIYNGCYLKVYVQNEYYNASAAELQLNNIVFDYSSTTGNKHL